ALKLGDGHVARGVRAREGSIRTYCEAAQLGRIRGIGKNLKYDVISHRRGVRIAGPIIFAVEERRNQRARVLEGARALALESDDSVDVSKEIISIGKRLVSENRRLVCPASSR